MGLTREQYDYLTKQLAESRVRQLRGQSHLEAWDVRRTLTRIFGFGGWDQEIIECSLAHESGVEKNGRVGWTVVYRVQMRLVNKDPNGAEIAHFEDGACGDSRNQPSVGDAHDMAQKTALSQALKRCAVNLGDQFGLSLYNEGRVDAVVIRSLVVPGDTATADDLEAAASKDAPVGSERTGDDEVPTDENFEDAAPRTVPAGPSMRAKALFEVITGAKTLDELKAAWDSTQEALGGNEITAPEHVQLGAHVKKLKAEMTAAANADREKVAA